MRNWFCLAATAVALSLSLALTPAALAEAAPGGIEVRVNPDAPYAASGPLPLGAGDRLEPIAPAEPPRYTPTLTDLYVTLPSAAGEPARRYRLDAAAPVLRDPAGEPAWRLPARLHAKLLRGADALRERHYGRLVPWEQAAKLLPRKSVFTITDLETGLSFRVQRRAGSDHADVQPVAREDTRVMKAIYRDGWSWRRKAIVVEAGGRRIAASMNGMPHGGDGIPGNDFKGHFCVHFLNSSTHKSPTPDPIHQLMIYKAAGKLRAFADAASPRQLGQLIVYAADHADRETIRALTEGLEREAYDRLDRDLSAFSAIRPLDRRRPADEAETVADTLVAAADLEVEGIHRQLGKRRGTLRLELARASVLAPWRIQRIELR